MVKRSHRSILQIKMILFRSDEDFDPGSRSFLTGRDLTFSSISIVERFAVKEVFGVRDFVLSFDLVMFRRLVSIFIMAHFSDWLLLTED